MLTGHSIPVCWAYLTRKTEDLYREGVFRFGYSRNLPFQNKMVQNTIYSKNKTRGKLCRKVYSNQQETIV